MRRTRSPWFNRTSSAQGFASNNNTNNGNNNVSASKAGALLSASHSVLRIHRKGPKGKVSDNTSAKKQHTTTTTTHHPQDQVNNNKKNKFTMQTSKSHLGFLPESHGSSGMLRLKRNKRANNNNSTIADRGPALPVDTTTDDALDPVGASKKDKYIKLSSQADGGFGGSGVLNFRKNKGADITTTTTTKKHTTTAAGSSRDEFGSSGLLSFRRNNSNNNNTKSSRPPVPSTAPPTTTTTPAVQKSGSKKKIIRNISSSSKRNTRKHDIGIRDAESGAKEGLEMRLKKRREALKSNLDAKASTDPTNEESALLPSGSRGNINNNSNAKHGGKRGRAASKTESKGQKAAGVEPDMGLNSFGVLVRKQPPTDTNISTRTESASSGSEMTSKNNNKPVVKIRCGRKGERVGSGFTSDRTRSGPIQRSTSYGSSSGKKEYNNTTTTTTRTRSGPIGINTSTTSSGTRTNSNNTSQHPNGGRTRSGPIGERHSESDSYRELRMQRRKRSNLNVVGGGFKNNNNNITVPTGSDSSSTSDDEPISTPRNAGINATTTAKVASHGMTSSPITATHDDGEDNNNSKNQSRAESMPHLRRRNYGENTHKILVDPRVCPVIPGLPTTKSFQNNTTTNTTTSPDEPHPISNTNNKNMNNHYNTYSDKVELGSKSMASLRRKSKHTNNSRSNSRNIITNGTQFDSDRAGDTSSTTTAGAGAYNYPKEAYPGGTNHGGSNSSMLRLRRLRHKYINKNNEGANNNIRSDSDQTPISPHSRNGSLPQHNINNTKQHESHSMLRLRRTKRLHVDANPALISTAEANPPPPLRYSHADLRISGWLSKKGKRLGTKVERLFTLRGCVLSNARGKGAKASWSINVRGAKVYGKTGKEIVISLPKAVLSFYAPTNEAQDRWIKALQAVSSSVFDFYDKGKQIGKGAYSEVFLGRDKVRNELCAIKVLQRPDADHGKLIDREINVLHMLNHSNIVQIYDIFETTKTTYIVMEFLPGGELLDMITDNDNLSEMCAKHVISQLLQAVSYLHMKDIVHRDIKPDNILCVGRTWPLHVKLTDFGLSQVVSGKDGVMRSQCGTAFYLAPEIARNSDYGKPVDLWACGIVLYVMLAGKFPFYGDSHKEFIRRLRNGVRFPHRQWKHISSDAKELVMCLLDPNPQSRLTADQALQHRWLNNNNRGPPKNNNNMEIFSNTEEHQSMPAVGMVVPKKKISSNYNNNSKRGYRDASNRSSALSNSNRYNNYGVEEMPSFTTSVSTQGDPQSESMVF